ncbi:MAG: TadE family protein, partial [Aquihabitans sp.]
MRTSRGTTVVEAAFVTPIFMMLILALMEGGMYMKDSLAVASTVRAGARAASASGAYEKADLYTVLNMGRESTALNRNDIDYVVIYMPSIDPLA